MNPFLNQSGLLWGLAVVGALLWSACGAAENPVSNDSPQCQCAANEQCVDGQCVFSCRDNADCAIGQVCAQDGQCLDVAPCAGDGDCALGQTCIDGGCYEAPCEEGAIQDCATACGEGIQTCVSGQFVDCTAPQPVAGECPPKLQPMLHRFDRSGSEIVEGMAAVADGIVLAGRTRIEESNDTWLVKFDLQGQPVWQMSVDGPDWDQLNALVAHNDQLLAFGQTQRRDGDAHDGLLQIHNADGTLQGARVLELDGANSLLDAAVTEGGRVVLAGRANFDGNAIWVVGLDEALEVAWHGIFDAPGTDNGRGVTARPGGGAVVVGQYQSPDDNGSDAFMAALSDNGEVLWQRGWGGTESEVAWAAAAHDGIVYVVGNTRSFGAGKQDVFILALDADGQLLWRKVIGTAEDETTNAVDVSAEGIFLGGRSNVGAGDNGAWMLHLTLDGEVLASHVYVNEGFCIANTLVTLPGATAWAGYLSQTSNTDWFLAVTPNNNVQANACSFVGQGPELQVSDEGSTLGDAVVDLVALDGGWRSINVTSQSTELEVVPDCPVNP